ncbi:MAG: DUF423 domain-containing protein [Cyclobacteriaceae bacterium]|nr:DUF423 domain-containing protein [Cyclobacteriaceae bacterium]
MNKYRIGLILTAVAGFLAVAIGAFGAHALKSLLTENNRLDTFELASRYHFYHTLVLLSTSLLLKQNHSKRFFLSLVFIVTGMILFSGSLYILAITNYTPIAMITPVGGLFLLAGWAVLLYAAFEKN